MGTPLVKIDVFPLKAKSLAGAHGREGRENKESTPGLLCQAEDGLSLACVKFGAC